ncbi:MAG: hypothetical protein EOO75_17615, partial [Myxococcales bacterium]
MTSREMRGIGSSREGSDARRRGARGRRRSERADEGQQGGAVVGRQGDEGVARPLPLAAVPQDGLVEAAGAPVVQVERVAVDDLEQAHTPERRRAPLAARRVDVGPVVGQLGAHVVEQEIGVGPDHLVDELRDRVGARAQVGCGSCHVGEMRTGAHAIPELADQLIRPYTDLLLHDMGPELADDRPDVDASGSEWRTPPLWGVGLFKV